MQDVVLAAQREDGVAVAGRTLSQLSASLDAVEQQLSELEGNVHEPSAASAL
jgi:hypothetical protein